MTVNFAPRSLADIDWRREPAPPSPAMQDAMDAIRRGVARDTHAIVKDRARAMIAGDLPLRFCARAARLVARLHRRQAAMRRAA